MLETLPDFKLAACDFLQFEALRQPGVQCCTLNSPACANQPVLVTGGDLVLDETQFNRWNTPAVKLWLAQKCLYEHVKLKPLPLGLPDWQHDPILGNPSVFTALRAQPKTLRNLVYLGFRDATADWERKTVRHLFAGRAAVTTTPYDRTPVGHQRYIENVYNHVFVLSPQGNGIDCHRTWETLYLRSIPIIRRHPALNFARHLPILFVDEWEQALDEKFLQQEALRLSRLTTDFSLLRLSFWQQHIQHYL